MRNAPTKKNIRLSERKRQSRLETVDGDVNALCANYRAQGQGQHASRRRDGKGGQGDNGHGRRRHAEKSSQRRARYSTAVSGAKSAIAAAHVRTGQATAGNDTSGDHRRSFFSFGDGSRRTPRGVPRAQGAAARRRAASEDARGMRRDRRGGATSEGTEGGE